MFSIRRIRLNTIIPIATWILTWFIVLLHRFLESEASFYLSTGALHVCPLRNESLCINRAKTELSAIGDNSWPRTHLCFQNPFHLIATRASGTLDAPHARNSPPASITYRYFPFNTGITGSRSRSPLLPIFHHLETDIPAIPRGSVSSIMHSPATSRNSLPFNPSRLPVTRGFDCITIAAYFTGCCICS